MTKIEPNDIILDTFWHNPFKYAPKTILSITDKGFCQSHNALPVKEIFNEDLEHVKILENLTIDTDYEIEMMISNGKTSRKRFILNSNLSFKNHNRRGNFMLSINNVYNFFDTTTSNIEVHPGYKYYIKVIPKQLITSADFRKLHPSQRKCLYLDENQNPKSIFKFYSQKSCQFECQLELPLRNWNLKQFCYPWFAPHWNTSTGICESYETFIFLDKLKEGFLE